MEEIERVLQAWRIAYEYTRYIIYSGSFCTQPCASIAFSHCPLYGDRFPCSCSWGWDVPLSKWSCRLSGELSHPHIPPCISTLSARGVNFCDTGYESFKDMAILFVSMQRIGLWDELCKFIWATKILIPPPLDRTGDMPKTICLSYVKPKCSSTVLSATQMNHSATWRRSMGGRNPLKF